MSTTPGVEYAVPADFAFTASELAAILKQPEAFQEAIDWNDCQETEADAMGMNSCAEHHRARAHELRQIRDRLMEARDGK